MKKSLIVASLFCAAALGSQAADAKTNWDENCAKCHGATGKGDTRMGQKLGAKDYTDAKVQASFTDEEAFKAVKNGVKADGKEKMKAYGDTLSDQDIKNLVAYLRSFKSSSSKLSAR